jgi:putative PEP-CTERM system TPR-repeat lipoprotein
MTIPRLGYIRTVCLAVTLALCGCGQNDTPALVKSAKAYLEKGDAPAAVIQLKNAAQKSPDDAELRMLLAQALLASGDPVGAEVEARKAIALKYPGEIPQVVVARALVERGEFAKTVAEFGDRTLQEPAARVDLGTSLAVAYLALGDRKKANAAIDAVLVDAPSDTRATLIKARIADVEGDTATASKLVDKVLATTPANAEALTFKALIESAQGHREQAIRLLMLAVESNPQALGSRGALIALLAIGNQVDLAADQVDKMKKLAPKDQRTIYSDALVSFVRGDWARTRDLTQQVLAAKPDHMPSLYLNGLANQRLGAGAAAEDSFRKVIALSPNEPSVRRALAAEYMRTGRATQALDVLEPALRRTPNDPAVLRSAAEAYFMTGNVARAAQLYEQANAIDQSDLSSKVRLAELRLATGEAERAFKDLEALSASDVEKNQADLALITAHLRRREFARALAAVDVLEKKQPNNAVTHMTRGTVYMAKADFPAARKAFEKALELQPLNVAAARNLALIDIQDGNPAEARKRFDALVAKDPKNEALLLANAEIVALTTTKPEDVTAALQKAIDSNPASTRARLAMITHLLRAQDPKAALIAAQAARSAFPTDPQITEVLGVAQLAAGEANQAVTTFRALAQQQPDNAAVMLRLADAQINAKDFSAALNSQRKALELQPNSLVAWTALERTYLRAGRMQDALAEARGYQKQKPGEGFGYALEGQVLASQKQYSEALRAQRLAFAKQPNALYAAQLYVVLDNAERKDERDQLAARWLKEHPRDTEFRNAVAQRSQERKDYKAAALQYRTIVDLEPDNFLALNNLAWLLGELGDPAAAEYAERAYRMSPFNPSIVDTLGWTLVRGKDPARGTMLLRLASNLAPGDAQIRLHLAQGLMKTGDKPAARRELEMVMKLDKDSPQRAEAEKLLVAL